MTTTKPQIIYDDGRPAFVVLSIADYLALSPESEALLTDEALYDMAQAEPAGVTVPHDVVRRLVDGESPIKVYREWRGLTQDALAEAAGVSTGYVSQLERGTRRLSRKMEAIFARALGVDVDDLTD